MLNTIQLNTTQLNGASQFFGAATQDDIVFNGLSLQSATIITQNLRQDDTPSREYPIFDIPRGHGGIVYGDYWRRKTISLAGIVLAASKDALDLALDEIKQYLAKREGVLDIKVNSEIRRYAATLINGDRLFSRRAGTDVTRCPFDIEFVTVEPFGYDESYSSQTIFDSTTLSYNDVFTNAGTAPAKPIIIFDFTAATAITGATLTNNTTGEQIVVTTALAALDYLEIDSENLEVRKNGTVIDYSGVFPLLNAGGNSWTITLSGTSATFTITEKHKTPYL